MKKLLKLVFVMALLLISPRYVFSQKTPKFTENSLSKSIHASKVKQYLNENQGDLLKEDLENLIISDEYYSKSSGITHIYVQQTYKGVKIYNAISSFAIKNNEIFYVGNVFKPNISKRINTVTPAITAQQAIENTANHFQLGRTSGLRMLNKNKNNFVYSSGNISQKEIPVNLVYTPLANGDLRLSWDLEIYTLDNKDMWSVRVDAADGSVIDQYNYVLTCNFGPVDHDHDEEVSPVNENKVKETASTNFDLFKTNATMMVDGSSYRVYDLPKESPSHGNLGLVNEPANVEASPFGWHDTNGRAGAEFTITRGNNVYAQEDANGNNGFGFAPDGGANLTFDFPIDLTKEPSEYVSGAVTNLFYGNNMMHDVWYAYGFDEASGNFQQNNYGKGGVGNDFVIADAQDGSGFNNANFGTPPDGGSGRMQMFLWNRPNPDRDGDLDNGIVAHEYGHGISIRLGGGPANSGCLRVQEQQGEGWSDWFGLMITMEPGDAAEDRRGIGTYALNQAPTGNGIRRFPYSTDFSINPFTYDDIKTQAVPHGVGSVWGTILWDLTWAYVEKYGWSPDLYNGTGGNNRVMQIVLDGLKLQPCGSGFVDSRDAILAADLAMTGGDDQCLIWEVFAKRGLGASADQGNADSRADGTEAFDIPDTIITVAKNADSCGTEMPELKITNFSGADITSFDYNYSIDGGPTVNETFSGNIAACSTGTLTLNLGTLSRGTRSVVFNIVNPPATKTFTVSANDSGVQNEVNTFETAADELITNDVTTWERGAAAGALLSAAVAGSQVYGTNLGGAHGNQKTAHLVSQCYDLSNSENTMLKFKMAFDLENNFDIMFVEYSTDNKNWTILGTADDTDWYNSDRTPNNADCQNCVGAQWTGEGELASSHSSGGTNASSMKNYSYPLNDFDSTGSAETSMLFRFTFLSDPAVTQEGVIIDDFVIESDVILSTDDNEFNNGITIFPNPTNGTVTIDSAISIENATISVYDVMGRVLTNETSTNTINANRISLDISKFSSGAYFVTINNGNRLATKRIIKN